MNSPRSSPRLAAVATAFFPISHADLILRRWNSHRPGDEDWAFPKANGRVVSLYVMQQHPVLFNGKATDPSFEAYAQDQGVALYSSIRDALTLGGSNLAVDGVLCIGEHGDFPTDKRGVKLYPRKEMFDAILEVFRESGRSAPVFMDKHLSWNREWAKEMVDDAAKWNVPLLAGSSISWCDLEPHSPPTEILRHPRQALAIFYGGGEVYGFHSLESALSVLEQRAGGESGIASLQVFQGDEVWELFRRESALAALLKKALCVSPTWNGYHPTETVSAPKAFRLEHRDGMRSTFVLLDGAIKDFSLALEGQDGHVWGGAFKAGNAENDYAHFAILDRVIDDFMASGCPPVPIQRTLLATLAISLAADHWHAGTDGVVPTPDLHIRYRPKKTFRISPCRLMPKQ